jgi:MoaA/NifB/PqqE/SkfB family radical SAM enzyme
MSPAKPERLNLAIGKRCFVHCEGCYTLFGTTEPDLDALRTSVRRFVDLSVDKVTISGGDPLTVSGIDDFLLDIRAAGIKLIKLDTVGTSLLNIEMHPAQHYPMALSKLVELVDYLGIPLDGWSNESVLWFRAGRPNLFNETVQLLDEIDHLNRTPSVVINTVLHRRSQPGLHLMLAEIARHRSICHWNIFQYTPTDRAKKHINDRFAMTDSEFEDAANTIRSLAESTEWQGERPTIEFRSVTSRLGEYLLVNSSGTAWLPDENGNTINLGSIYERETEILAQWAEVAGQIQSRKLAP